MSGKKSIACQHGNRGACTFCKVERELNAMLAELFGGPQPRTRKTQPGKAPISLADERRKRARVQP